MGRRGMDDIKIELKKRRNGIVWTGVTLIRIMNLRVSQSSGKFLSSCIFGGFSKRAQLFEVSKLVN
jgi:hypothetical protein